MSDTNGNGSTVKEMVRGLTDRVEAYMNGQTAQNAHLQEQISQLRVDQAVHSAGDGHINLANSLTTANSKLDTLISNQAEKRGEDRANARAWKIIAAVASIPGVSALAAIIFGQQQ